MIELLTSIQAPYGKYAILSETDMAHQTELHALYLEAGFEILNSKLIPIHVLGQASMNLIGWDSQSPSTLLGTIQPTQYTIAFASDPDFATILNGQGVDVMFAGKTHGGQVTLPFIGPMVYKDEVYQKGHYQLSQLDLYVSTGIGVSGLKARWMTDPSYTLVTFKTK
jgi:predicted MPP superfamily phosphohydrolase